MDFMSKTDIAKNVVGVVVAAGTAIIVKGIIENNTNVEKVTERIALYAASAAIAGIAKQRTRKYSDELIDKIVNTWNKVVEESKAPEITEE